MGGKVVKPLPTDAVSIKTPQSRGARYTTQVVDVNLSGQKAVPDRLKEGMQFHVACKH
jgi:hypothetical protein